ncbi:MAG: hypothetical protein ACRECV_05400 [Xanthobacteraceae bacterium]
MIDPLHVGCGFAVGYLVGMTGVGGGFADDALAGARSPPRPPAHNWLGLTMGVLVTTTSVGAGAIWSESGYSV